MGNDSKGVDEGRRNTLKFLLGVCTAAGVAISIPPPLLSVLSHYGEAPSLDAYPYVSFCSEDKIEECPYVNLSDVVDAVSQGNGLFRVITKGTIAVPAVFGVVVASNGKRYVIAFNEVCTHFGCPVSPVVNNGQLSLLACPCHGSQFQVITDPSDPAFLGTRVIAGPAPRPLRPVKIYPVDFDEINTKTGGRIYVLGAYI